MTAFEGMVKVSLQPLPGFTGDDVVRVLEKYNSHDIEVVTDQQIRARIHKSAMEDIESVAYITERISLP